MSGGARSWLEVTVAAPEGLPAELVTAYLVEAGAPGVEEREGTEGRVVLVAHIPGDRLPLEAAFIAAHGATVTASRQVPDHDWEAEWRAGLAPVLLGKRLAIVPPSGAGAAPEGRIALRIEPGSAFGSGLHPTTALVAAALEDVLGERPGASLLDVGTGSGILAIAAVKLGARPVLAVDNDPEAVAETRRNAERNGIAAGQPFEASDAAAADIADRGRHFTVVVANLDAPTLTAIGRDVARCVDAGGELIVSGLRADDRWPGPGEGFGPAVSFARDGWRCERYRRS